MPPIPAASCLQLLAQVLESLGAILRALRSHPEYQSLLLSDPLSTAVLLHNADPQKLPEPTRRLRTYFLNESPFGQTNVLAQLEALLASDSHIRATCRSSWGLAKAIELLVPGLIAQVTDTPGNDTYAYGAIAPYLLERIFETDYQRQGLIHIYNLQVETPPPLDIPAYKAKILTLRDNEIPLLTNETTPTSSLHPSGIGNNFISFVDTGYDNDFEWMQKKWIEAWEITRVLKYMKYGIVDNDYGGIHYAPTWMNRIWKVGVYMWGRPRLDLQAAPFRINEAEKKTFFDYVKAAQRLAPILNSTCSLRKATEFAGNYYQAHHVRTSKEDQLIDLVIALEAMFSPSHEGELQFRMAQRLATLLGKDAEGRKQIFNLTKKIYTERSKLVHGGGNPFTTGTLTVDELAQFGDYIRQAILRLLMLIVSGETEKKAAEKIMDDAALDPTILKLLRDKSDFDNFLKEETAVLTPVQRA